MVHRIKALVFLMIMCSLVAVANVKLEEARASIINGERPIVVIITSYNNSKWYQYNLSTLFSQQYSNYRVVYIDDCSDDGTAELVEQFIIKSNQQHRVQLIKNTERHGALYGLYHAIHASDSRAIIITYDGDDWFKGNNVLQTINQAYSDPNVWLTYGQFECFPGNRPGQCRSMPAEVIKASSYRSQPWITSQLRTFYAGLFKHIQKEDLLFEGKFFDVAWDFAFMFPMLEMANGHIKFIDKVIYVYNQVNPINDFRVNLRRQEYYARLIRGKSSYKPLDPYEVKSSFVLG